MDDLSPFLERGAGRNELVIALHGFTGSAATMAGVRSAIREAKPDADIYAPNMSNASWRGRFSTKKAELFVVELVDAIDRLVEQRLREGSGGYQKMTLVGHSFGAVLARKIAIVAHGEQQSSGGDCPAPFEPELKRFRKRRAWAAMIERIVLLAGMNRGWSVSSAMDWITAVLWSVLSFLGDTVLSGKPTIFAIRRGAPFLVQTRLQWIALMDPDCGSRPDIMIVQLLGTVDDHVAPDDNVDYAVDLFGVSKEERCYFYVEVRHSNHGNVIKMERGGLVDDEGARNERRQKFDLALTADRHRLAHECIPRELMEDSLPSAPNPQVTDVVFVVHGIRDKGYWTQKIARTIKKHAGQDRRFESETASYGYFAMLPFIFRTVRQRKVEWLMDRYAEARARYPKAKFHYVGHSNGTYLAAKALEDYPSARFKHIVFAGSVVRCDYDWLRWMQPNPEWPKSNLRVERVLNYVATRDWVVALFPKGLQPFRRLNLGSAGHDGFHQASTTGPVHEVRYIVGSHGAGHGEPHWDDIARFIVSGVEPPQQSPPLFSKTPNHFLRAIGRCSSVIFAALVVLVGGFGLLLLWSIFVKPPCGVVPYLRDVMGSLCTQPSSAGEAGLRTIGFFVYSIVVYLAVTRF